MGKGEGGIGDWRCGGWRKGEKGNKRVVGVAGCDVVAEMGMGREVAGCEIFFLSKFFLMLLRGRM